MADERVRKAWEQMTREPFLPVGVTGGSQKPEERIANALDYIAAQLGQLNANLTKLLEK